jgi:hypothetical protein
VNLETRPRSGGSGEAAVVGPTTAGRHERIGARREGRPDEELEIAELVPAEGQWQQILALDP